MHMMCATRLIVLGGNGFTRGGRAASLTAPRLLGVQRADRAVIV